MTGVQLRHAPQSLSAVIGHDDDGAPVHVSLTNNRPHVSWAGDVEAGKSSQLQLVTRQLLSQIPAIPDRLRLVLFESSARDQTFTDLHDLDGVLVIHPDSPFGPRAYAAAAALQRLRDELQWRREHPETWVPPLVIAVDEYVRWRSECPLLNLIVTEQAASVGPHSQPAGGYRLTPPTGIHLLLTSLSLSDFTPPRSVTMSGLDAPALPVPDTYTCVILPTTYEDTIEFQFLLTVLGSICGRGVAPTSHSTGWRTLNTPRQAYRLTSTSAARFHTTNQLDPITRVS